MPRNYAFGTNGNNGEKVGLDAWINTSLGTDQIRTPVTVFGLLFELLRSLKVFFAGVRRFPGCTPIAVQFYSVHSRTAIEQGASMISLPAKCSCSIRTFTVSSFVSPGE